VTKQLFSYMFLYEIACIRKHLAEISCYFFTCTCKFLSTQPCREEHRRRKLSRRGWGGGWREPTRLVCFHTAHLSPILVRMGVERIVTLSSILTLDHIHGFKTCTLNGCITRACFAAGRVDLGLTKAFSVFSERALFVNFVR